MLRLPDTSDALDVILKLPGETCNINCSYCFEKRKPYGDHLNIEPDVLRNFLGKLGVRPLALELHGGEPLILGMARMRLILDELKRYPGDIDLYIQTNGLLLDDKWIDFFESEWPSIRIGISLDGDAQASAYRVDYQGKLTHEKVEEALRLLNSRSMRVGVIAVVTRASLGREREILARFAEFPSIKAVKFSPCFDFNIGNKGAHIKLSDVNIKGMPMWGISPAEFTSFLTSTFDAWRQDGYFNDYVIEPFVSILRVLAGKPSGSCHFNEQKCAHLLTLYPDGRVGSCDELPMPQSLLGTLTDIGLIDQSTLPTRNPELHAKLNSLLDKCTNCAYQPTCGGGCLATRLRYHGTTLYEDYCAHRMNIIDHVRVSATDTVGSSQ